MGPSSLGRADPIAALTMLPFVLHEGWEAIEEAREAEPDDSDG